MKVRRQGLTENYNTTSEWVSEFEKNLEKQSNYLDNLKTILRKRNDFSTIEEKMADIKSRAGFHVIKEADESDLSKQASECATCSGGCGCGDKCDCNASCKCCGSTCSCKVYNCKQCNSDIIGKAKNIVNYMKSFCEHRPDVGIAAAITHCKNNPDLNYQEVASRIDVKKFEDFLQNLLKKSEEPKEEVKYIPENMDDQVGSDVADYFEHANPTG